MKRVLTFASAAVVVLVGLSVNGIFSENTGVNSPIFAGGGGGSQSLRFDTFCDGVTITRVPGTPLFTGNFCGCITASFIATLGGSGSNLALHLHPNEAELGLVVQYIIRADRTWELYGASGLLNSGTWSGGCPVFVDGVELPSTLDGLLD